MKNKNLDMHINYKRNTLQLFENKIDEEKKQEWLTSIEVCSYLKISKKTLMNKVSLGHIPRFKFGRLNRYLKSEIEELIMPTPRRGERRWE